MKFVIVLNGTGGELDRVTVENKGNDDCLSMLDFIDAMLVADWTLADGDEITVSVQS